MNRAEFEKDLISLINRHSMEGASNTPDYLLGKYLMGCLDMYASVVNERDYWGKGGVLRSEEVVSLE